jgi:N-acetylglucosaminyl-diphospho-decaprenol L-rhamnosyltransferase
MRLSVIVVTYDSAACIRDCLTSVRAFLPEAEILVVDNASHDETTKLAAAAAPDARLIDSGENLGFGRACNFGAEAATGEHLLLLNPDVVLTGTDRPELDALLVSRPFGLAAPLLRWGDEKSDTIGAQAERRWLSDYVDHTIQTVLPRGVRHGRRPAAAEDAAWASGAMLLVDRGEFLSLGGFDPRFFLYYEDRDLSARYRAARLPIRTTTALAGRHAGGASSAIDDLRVTSLGWSFMGWLQYLYIHDGERAARRGAFAGVRTLRAIGAAVTALGRMTRRQRFARKQRQLADLLAFLEEQADDGAVPPGGIPFCPEARQLLARVT